MRREEKGEGNVSVEKGEGKKGTTLRKFFILRSSSCNLFVRLLDKIMSILGIQTQILILKNA
jgi:hypothetical protein